MVPAGNRGLVFVSTLIAAAAVGFIATHLDQARAVLAQVSRLPLSTLAAAFLLVLAQLALQSLRQWAVVPQDLGLGPLRVARAFLLGEWLNMFAPARSGDALKAVLIKRGSAGPSGLPSATGAVLADKVVDLTSLVLLCSAGGLIGLLWTQVRAGALAAAIGGGIVVALWASFRCGGGQLGNGPRTWVRDLVGGLSALRDPRRCLSGLSFSLAGWIAEGCAVWVLCATLGVTLLASQILLALVVLNVGISVPISLANLGVYEAAMVAGLSHIGVPLPTALAVAVTHHCLELLAATVGAAALSLRTFHSAFTVRRSKRS